MTPINPKRYDMNPSQNDVERVVESFNINIISMNIFGGGAFHVEDVKLCLRKFRNVKSCVVGASSEKKFKGILRGAKLGDWKVLILPPGVFK